MYNKYTIDLKDTGEEVKATIYVGKNSLGVVWVPKLKLKNKEDYKYLFDSIACVIYGQETKEAKEAESDSIMLALPET